MSRQTFEARKRYRAKAFEAARRTYRLLIRIVGGANPVCAICRCTEAERPMQLDHINGKNWRAKDMRMDQRVKRYRDELKAGVKFRVLCIECNAKDGRARQMEGRVHADSSSGEHAEPSKLELKHGVLFQEGEELF